jgi:hypothetical protein
MGVRSYTYPRFQKLTPELTLEEIWYGSRRLYLSTFSKKMVRHGQSHLALDQSQIALTTFPMSDGALGNFSKSKKIWFTRIKARLLSTRGLLMRFGTMGTTSPRLGREE